MDACKKTLTITAWVWSDEAARMLAGTLRGVPCYTVEDYRREIAAGCATLYRVATVEGATVGYAVLRVEQYAGGAEGVILAAAGSLRGAHLYEELLPAFEALFRNIKSFRIDNCRRGAMAKLRAAGYVPTHVVMRKPAAPARTLQQNLEALAAVGENLGGGHLCAGPGGRPHKGGGSASSTTQSTQNVDRRQVVDSGSVGVSSDTSTVNVSVLDGGAIMAAQQIANNALAQNADATRSAAAAVAAAMALVGDKDAQGGRTLADMLQFGRDAFSSSTDAQQRTVSDSLDFASRTFESVDDQNRRTMQEAYMYAGSAAERADDTARRAVQDSLDFASRAFESVDDQNRRTMQEAYMYAGSAAERADDTARRATQDALTYAGAAAERADDAGRRAMQDSYTFAQSAFENVDDQNRRALQESLGFADASAERANDLTWRTFSDALTFSRDVFDTGIGVLDKAGVQIGAQTDLIARAYDNAKGEGTQKTYVAYAALAAVAVVVVAAWGKK